MKSDSYRRRLLILAQTECATLRSVKVKGYCDMLICSASVTRVPSTLKRSLSWMRCTQWVEILNHSSFISEEGSLEFCRSGSLHKELISAALDFIDKLHLLPPPQCDNSTPFRHPRLTAVSVETVSHNPVARMSSVQSKASSRGQKTSAFEWEHAAALRSRLNNYIF